VDIRLFFRATVLFFFLAGTLPARADIIDDVESPVTTDAKWILITGTALTVGIIVTQNSLSGPWELKVAHDRPLGKYSKYGDMLGQDLPNALYVGGMLAAYYFGADKALGRAWLMFEASSYAVLATTVLKYNVGEGRPYDGTVRSSFPSGHSTSAFSFAGVIAAEHGWYWGAPAMALATFVAYSRINDTEHRLHDVVAGATVGLTAAYGVYYSHQINDKNKSTGLQLMPVTIPGGGELLANWNF
jgi:membrane-associated phospholipid phosphatase